MKVYISVALFMQEKKYQEKLFISFQLSQRELEVHSKIGKYQCKS